MRAILLMLIGINLLYAGDVVRDNSTGLTWQDNEEAKINKKSWSAAKSYCQHLTLDGKNNWRLPTIKELQSIVDIGKENPSIKNGYSSVASYAYWSSSAYVSDSSKAWIVFFNYGYENYYFKTRKFHVRCVRNRQ